MIELNVLALDPATLCGWALHVAGADTDIYGVWDLSTLKDESMGMKLLRFRAKLNKVDELVQGHGHAGLDLIVFERPAGHHTNAVIHHAKMVGIIEAFCESREGLEYKGYSASSIKKHATGKGNASKSKVIKAAREKLHYTGDDDNEADALWLLSLARQELEQ